MEDLGDAPATKADIQALHAALQGFATKEDLKSFATNDGVQAVKTKLDQAVHRLAADQVNILKKMDDMKEELKSHTSALWGEVIKTLDKFTGKIEVFERESIRFPNSLDVHGRRLDGHDAKIKNHDARITSLESKGKE